MMHQSPASLSRAGLWKWSRRESNPSPPARPDQTYHITGKQLTSHPRPPLLPGLLPRSNRGASGHGLAPPGAEPSAAWAPPYPLARPGPRRAAGSPPTLMPPRPPASPPSTAAGGPRPHPSTPSSSTTSRPSWPEPPRQTHGARAWRGGSRRTSDLRPPNPASLRSTPASGSTPWPPMQVSDGRLVALQTGTTRPPLSGRA
jgi:hypothetical protein